MPTGIYIRTEKMRKNMSRARLERKKKLGYVNSPEARKKMSKSRIGKIGNLSSCWKGGKIQKYGYILVRKPKHPFCNKRGYIREHRLIIEKQIGRYLKPEERSHHLNKIKDDNHPENLMAFTSDSAHQRFQKNPNNVKPKEIIFDGRKI